MQAHERLFPGFFSAGFECSTPINGARQRIDQLALTHHDRRIEADYALLREVGIHTIREGVRWHAIDRRGGLDFASARPFVDAAYRTGMTPIWDLFHYGYPDDLDPFGDAFVERFARYCAAFATLVAEHTDRVPFYTPINEISYLAWAGGDAAVFAPYARGRAGELKRNLVRAAIAGIDAIRGVDPRARIVNVDPIVRVVAPRDRPDLQGEADHFNEQCVFEALDMLAGRRAPELGGSPRRLDIVGLNYYGVNQWEHTRPGSVLAVNDPRRAPLRVLLQQVWERYRAPLLISETSGCGDGRPQWLRDVFRESLAARKAGVALCGICLYPILSMYDWHAPCQLHPYGVWDLRDNGDGLERVPHAPTLAELRSLQAAVARNGQATA